MVTQVMKEVRRAAFPVKQARDQHMEAAPILGWRDKGRRWCYQSSKVQDTSRY